MNPKSTDPMKIPRLIARILSALFVGFALMMFIGETLESSKRVNPEPMTFYTIIQLGLFGGIHPTGRMFFQWLQGYNFGSKRV